MTAAAVEFPPSAPLLPLKGAPATYKPVMLNSYLFPTVVENVGTVLGIDVGFIPETVVAAKWNKAPFPAASTWAVTRMTINFERAASVAFLLQPLETAMEWGAIGLRRPASQRQAPAVGPDGAVNMTEAQEQDFAAYYEVCNVISCGVLARAWRTKLDKPLFILLDDVAAVTAQRFPAELDAKNLIAVQGIAGYSERKQPSRNGQPVYERLAPLQLILPAPLAAQVLWGVADGEEKKKTDWLAKTGVWRWASK
jgi:hypothetical protein